MSSAYNSSSGQQSVPAGTQGPHSTMGNILDPRVDSDASRDNTKNPDQNFGVSGITSGNNYTRPGNSAPNTVGPHKSDMLNKMDPTVDSDLSSQPHGSTYGNTGAGTFGTSGATGTGSGGLSGPHHSDAMNMVDPSVDSGTGLQGTHLGTHHAHNTHNTHHGAGGIPGTAGSTGMYGTDGSTGTTFRGQGAEYGTASTGPLQSQTMNKLDPSIDSTSGLPGTHHGTHHDTLGTSNTHHADDTYGGSVAGTGPAKNTTGPHKSDLLNKLDPRVDSTGDGVKGMGK